MNVTSHPAFFPLNCPPIMRTDGSLSANVSQSLSPQNTENMVIFHGIKVRWKGFEAVYMVLGEKGSHYIFFLLLLFKSSKKKKIMDWGKLNIEFS